MFASFMEEGGFTMVPVLLLGFALTAVSGLHVLRPTKFLGASVGLAVTLASSSLFGYFHAAKTTLRAAATFEDEAARPRIVLGGLSESSNNLELGLIFLALAGVCWAVAAYRRDRGVPA